METIYTNHRKEIKMGFNEPINLWFFGDMHYDSPTCDRERLRWFLESAKKDIEERTYFFGMGDYGDLASTSERKAIRSIDAKLHDDTKLALDLLVEKQNREIAQELMFMKGRLLGLIDGNHNWEFQNGKNATEDLCERLDALYLGWLCYFELAVLLDNSKHTCIDFVLCHGKAGGKTAGITINQVDDMRRIFPAADVYVQGHDHQRYAVPADVLIKKEGTIKQHRQFLCRSGSFKKGYMPGQGGYEVGRLLKPADLGALKLVIGFHRDRRDDKDRIITDISAII